MPKTTAPRKDELLLSAVGVAQEAAEAVGRPGAVGEHVSATMTEERLAVHRFRTNDPGYVGWMWEVSLVRAPRSKTITVCEVGLTPGDTALLAPAWVPWEERLQPGDVSRDDVLPFNANDARLVAGFEESDPEIRDQLGIDEPGYGRPRVLSAVGIDEAAERWYASDRGPIAGLKPGNTCSSCGFLMKMNGSLGQVFGVCANGWAQDDGTVVALEHGCGAHSETDEKKRRVQWPIVPPRIDDFTVDTMGLRD